MKRFWSVTSIRCLSRLSCVLSKLCAQPSRPPYRTITMPYLWFFCRPYITPKNARLYPISKLSIYLMLTANTEQVSILFAVTFDLFTIRIECLVLAFVLFVVSIMHQPHEVRIYRSSQLHMVRSTSLFPIGHLAEVHIHSRSCRYG